MNPHKATSAWACPFYAILATTVQDGEDVYPEGTIVKVVSMQASGEPYAHYIVQKDGAGPCFAVEPSAIVLTEGAPRMLTQKDPWNACDFDHITREETRLLPYGGEGNIIVCHAHYLEEMHRKDMASPAWANLKVYDQAIRKPRRQRPVVAPATLQCATLADARDMVEAVATWLQAYTEPCAPEEFPCAGEDKSAALARQWAHRLLKASRANGLHGCLGPGPGHKEIPMRDHCNLCGSTLKLYALEPAATHKCTTVQKEIDYGSVSYGRRNGC